MSRKVAIGAYVDYELKQRLLGTSKRDDRDQSKTLVRILEKELPPLKAVQKYL